MSLAKPLLRTAILLPLLGSLGGCYEDLLSSESDSTSSSSASTSTDSSTTTTTGDTTTDTGDSTTSTGKNSRGWIVNTTDERSKEIFGASTNQGVLVNIKSVETTTVNGKDFEKVTASGIPNYRVTITQAIVDILNSRPKASTDFTSGQTTAKVGDVVEFGQDIGYKSSATNCNTTGGYGYWPPGPECPQDTAKTDYFPLQPTANTGTCYTGMGPIGLMVNGASIYNWNDGQTYNNEGVWHNTAANAEVHDLDICSGHSARNDYHHHNWSTCQAEQIGDKGDGHSPIYGYAADGYPVYGPWYAKGVLAQSAWVKRDYESADSASGCGGSGARSCLLNDSYDLSKGTTTASKPGPATTGTIISQSGNPIPAVSGLYFEDYYYDASLSAKAGAYLDANNGHDHDGLGYHYHLTMAPDTTGKLVPAFPFTFGPKFQGQLESNALTTCGSSAVTTTTAGAVAGGGGGQLPPPGGMMPPPGGAAPTTM